MKVKLLWCLPLFFSLSGCENKHEPVIEEGFVTFATAGYFGLLEVLIASVHAFSTRPIVVYGVYDDVPFSTEKYPRLIKRRLDKVRGGIFTQKSRIILESGIKYGVYVEADDILNQGIDELFTWCRKVKEYPLCPIHPDDPRNQKNIMDLLEVSQKTMHYIHAHVLFSQECMPFIKEWHDICMRYESMASNADETILNVLLWKKGVTEYVPVYDPYFALYKEYIKGEKPVAGYDHLKTPVYYYMFHGCKIVSDSWHILEELITYSQR